MKPTTNLHPTLLRPYLRLTGRALLVLCCCLALAAPAHAQPADPSPDEFQRSLQRAAPVRHPQILRSAVSAAGVANTLVELPAVADVYIASQRPNQNFGADSLFLGYNSVGDGFGAERILIRFDIENNIPANAVVHSARLRLQLSFSSPSQDAPMGAALRRITAAWDEAGVTWNQEPAWVDSGIHAEVGSAPAWYEWDATALVAGWANRSYPNYGMEIIGDERVQQRERAFYARETTSEFFPRLVVDYSVVDDRQPPSVSVQPLPSFSGRNFTVEWEGEDPGGSGIDCYDVQYRVDGGDWVDWLNCVETTQAEFPNGQNGRLYEFRARGRDQAGNVELYGGVEASTRVDTQPPVTRVEALPGILGVREFTVRWSGSDQGGSGIRHYDVRYRYDNGPWTPWQQGTTATSAQFFAATDGVYEFEARAVDHRGMVEDFTGRPEAGVVIDAEAPFLTHYYFPLAALGGLPGRPTFD